MATGLAGADFDRADPRSAESYSHPAGSPRAARISCVERASLRRIGSGSVLTVFGPISTNSVQFRAAWVATLSAVIGSYRAGGVSARRYRVNAGFSARHAGVS
jgi:hypothetical protein